MEYVFPNPLSPITSVWGLAAPLSGSGFQKTGSPVETSAPRYTGATVRSAARRAGTAAIAVSSTAGGGGAGAGAAVPAEARARSRGGRGAGELP